MWVGIWTFEKCSYYICLFLLCVGVGGMGTISGTAEVWRSKDNLKQSVFLLPCGPGD